MKNKIQKTFIYCLGILAGITGFYGNGFAETPEQKTIKRCSGRTVFTI